MFCSYGYNCLQCYMTIIHCTIIILITEVTVSVLQVIGVISLLTQNNIVRNSKVSAFIFWTEINSYTIWLIKYFQCTHLHTASLSFVVTSGIYYIVGNSEVRAFLSNYIFLWVNSSVFLIHSPSWFITLMHCFANLI